MYRNYNQNNLNVYINIIVMYIYVASYYVCIYYIGYIPMNPSFLEQLLFNSGLHNLYNHRSGICLILKLYIPYNKIIDNLKLTFFRKISFIFHKQISF